MRHIGKTLTLTAALFVMGCGSDDNNFLFGPFPNPTNTPGVTAPVAVADSFTTLGNSVLTGSVTANDTLNGATVTAFQNPGNSGGTVVISSAGTLTYTPPLNAANVNDTFTYTLTNSAGSSTATVTVNVQARGFFVKNDVAATGTGTQANPFKTLAEAVTAANGVNGAQIVLFRGDGTTTGQTTPVPLGTNQGISSLDPANQATITGPVTLTSGNAIKDLRIQGTPGNAISGTNSAGGSLTGVTITNPTLSGCALVNATGSFTAANCTLSNTGSHGFVASADSTSLIWTVNNCAFANVGAVGVFCNITNTAAQNVTVSNSSSTGSTGDFFFVRANTVATNVGATMTNSTAVNSGARGFEAALQGTANFLGLISANNVTGSVGEGMQVLINDTATGRMRFTSNRTTGNLANRGLVVTGGTPNPNVGAIFTNNTSDAFLLQANSGTFRVEQLAQFNGTSGNIGALLTAGTITDVPAGTLGIP